MIEVFFHVMFILFWCSSILLRFRQAEFFWLFPSMANRDTFYCILIYTYLYYITWYHCGVSPQFRPRLHLFAHKMCSCWPISGHHLMEDVQRKQRFQTVGMPVVGHQCPKTAHIFFQALNVMCAHGHVMRIHYKHLYN